MLPPISLWLEETGYFKRDGTQRLLRRNLDAANRHGLAAVMELAVRYGRDVEEQERFMNKDKRGIQCPCLEHLTREQPYISFGWNDAHSAIHQTNESILMANVPLSIEQFVAFVKRLG